MVQYSQTINLIKVEWEVTMSSRKIRFTKFEQQSRMRHPAGLQLFESIPLPEISSPPHSQYDGNQGLKEDGEN